MFAYYAKTSPQGLYTIKTKYRHCSATLFVDGLRDYRCPACYKDL